MDWVHLKLFWEKGSRALIWKAISSGSFSFFNHPQTRLPLISLQVKGSILLKGNALVFQQGPLLLPAADLVGRKPAVMINHPLPGHGSSGRIEDTSHLPRGPWRVGQGCHLPIGQDVTAWDGPHYLQDPLLKKINRFTLRVCLQGTSDPAIFPN